MAMGIYIVPGIMGPVSLDRKVRRFWAGRWSQQEGSLPIGMGPLTNVLGLG